MLGFALGQICAVSSNLLNLPGYLAVASFFVYSANPAIVRLAKVGELLQRFD